MSESHVTTVTDCYLAVALFWLMWFFWGSTDHTLVGVLFTLLSNTRPHQLCVGDWEMGTAISCKKGSQVAGLAHNIFWGSSISKANHQLTTLPCTPWSRPHWENSSQWNCIIWQTWCHSAHLSTTRLLIYSSQWHREVGSRLRTIFTNLTLASCFANLTLLSV